MQREKKKSRKITAKTKMIKMALSHQNQFRSPPSILTGYIDAITAIAWRLLLSLLGLYGHICAVCENLVSSGDHLPKPIETTHLYDDVPCLILKHTAGGTWQQPQNAVCASLLHTEKCYKALRLHFCYTFRQHLSLPGSRSGRCFASDASFFFLNLCHLVQSRLWHFQVWPSFWWCGAAEEHSNWSDCQSNKCLLPLGCLIHCKQLICFYPYILCS